MEDTRSPQIKQEQAMQAEEVDREGQARVAQAISKVLKQPKPRYKTMPKQGETVTVKNMKAAINKAQSKHQQPVDNHVHNHNPEVVNADKLHSQPNHNLQVVDNTKEHKKTTCNEVDILKEDADMFVLNNEVVNQLVDNGMTAQQIKDALGTLLPLYRAEGITPTSAVLMAGIMQLAADTR
jgi:hypothetical protein